MVLHYIIIYIRRVIIVLIAILINLFDHQISWWGHFDPHFNFLWGMLSVRSLNIDGFVFTDIRVHDIYVYNTLNVA